ncbi:uncharacterized protein LOC129242376 [Anastrepha obliqua]|uniref:uncharacterized protein LOC128861374 n=1 Tax=Anastrepha ludens TaxID=28586 RepID=UPI0023B0BD23|nr:uncharacterized protein LOC128861374 [Anastrepha ludens]XP_054734329.1 uncharacterized protein LOC129241832 [Anastrepha obliqua]XP_054734957.1 uncharacterized protein LOC129242376 [Anastrepha obliqua]
MVVGKKSAAYVVIFLVLLACCIQESEATRRVLRGRRTLTRRYFTGLAIPGWLLPVLIGIGELVLGGALYLVLNRVILAKSVQETSTYTPAKQHEV